jgi:hypothetical protein
MLAAFTMAPDEPALEEAEALADEPPEPGVDELPHAAAVSATASKPAAAHHRLGIAFPYVAPK